MNDEDLNVPVMLSIREASRRSGISYEAIRRMCINRQISFVRVGKQGGKYLINWERFILFLERGESD